MVAKNAHISTSQALLARLAALYGVQTRYRDALGRERVSPDESVIQTLLALGAKVNGTSGLESAVRSRERELQSRMMEPVVIAWEGVLPDLTFRLPPRVHATGRVVFCELQLEEEVVRWSLPLDGLPAGDPAGVGADAGGSSGIHRVPSGWMRRATAGATGALPLGYHRLRIEVEGRVGETLVISAPRRCWQRPSRAQEVHGAVDFPLRLLAGRDWGLFAPVYALRSARDWGAGDLADLETLMAWTAEQGGAYVATLPLLAASFAPEADPSPYRPLSRLFWNEFFIAPELATGWNSCPQGQALWSDAAGRELRERLRAQDLVDYRAVMALKRPVLEELASCLDAVGADSDRKDFDGYMRENPLVRDYAAFRADGEVRSGHEAGADRAASERYHLYCQWQMDRQLAALRSSGSWGLMLDLPLGVHPDGFDLVRWPGLFAGGVSTGAPPDAFFADGQDWTTPPLHPEADRLNGYEYFRGCLGTQMGPASALRIDHIMAFRRLFWIPDGMKAAAGVYVTYPAEELYAVLSAESHRHETEVVGEDLGTVPAGVRAGMRRHGVARTCRACWVRYAPAGRA